MLYKRDLTKLKFSLSTGKSTGTGGSFFKARDDVGDYYKLSYMCGKSIIGFESVYEEIANELLKQRGLSHINGELIWAKVKIEDNVFDTYLWKTQNYNPNEYPVITLENYMESIGIDTSDKVAILKEIANMSQDNRNQLYEMVLFDYLIRNVDRHGANIELMCHDGMFKCTPIFDNGSSFFATCQNNVEQIKTFDYVKNSPVNNFIGSFYLEDAAEKILDVYNPNEYSFNLSFLDKYIPCFSSLGINMTSRISEMIQFRQELLNEMIRDKKKEQEYV